MNPALNLMLLISDTKEAYGKSLGVGSPLYSQKDGDSLEEAGFPEWVKGRHVIDSPVDPKWWIPSMLDLLIQEHWLQDGYEIPQIFVLSPKRIAFSFLSKKSSKSLPGHGLELRVAKKDFSTTLIRSFSSKFDAKDRECLELQILDSPQQEEGGTFLLPLPKPLLERALNALTLILSAEGKEWNHELNNQVLGESLNNLLFPNSIPAEYVEPPLSNAEVTENPEEAVAKSTPTNSANTAVQLLELNELRKSGLISDQEFEKLKQSLLGS